METLENLREYAVRMNKVKEAMDDITRRAKKLESTDLLLVFYEDTIAAMTKLLEVLEREQEKRRIPKVA